MYSELLSELAAELKCKPKQGVLGRDLSTFCIGGPVDCLFEPNSEQELLALLRAARSAGQAVKILGAGSNLLISDQGVQDCVLRLGRGFRYCKALGDDRFEVGASSALMSLSRDLSEQGYSGLEFAGGIPASFGGALRMNAGAHGGQIWERLERVRFVSPEEEIQDLPVSELSYAYRHCSLPAEAVILGGVLKLKAGLVDECSAQRARFLTERKERQPLTVPCAGSVFKNPKPDLSAGMLIERAGLKGRTHGGAEISSKHANWIVNPKREAKAADVRALVDLCVSTVEKEQGISLEREIIYW